MGRRTSCLDAKHEAQTGIVPLHLVFLRAATTASERDTDDKEHVELTSVDKLGKLSGHTNLCPWDSSVLAPS
jgi:hypothetical protein